ncbi:MAG TPA: molybdopterin-dependent oxidoreductase [Gemmataceae bacterium]|jgi:DMSO/TMAO reductase YedYZ molybdopterin-dependent catalytic subunit
MSEKAQERKLLTDAEAFRDVSRGNPKPFNLKGEELAKARLTPSTWRLEIIGEGSAKLQHPRRLQDGTAIDLPTLEDLGERHGVKFLKAMQCLNIAQPLGQGLWEGVPLREVLKLAGKTRGARRIFWWGFHNNWPNQLFQSSLSYSQVMETPPDNLPVFVAYRLNGKPISLLRGGPVRMIVPWGHGFKSIKWLQNITLTGDFKANDTYADAGNDPESYLKTMARIDEGAESFAADRPIVLSGVAMVGWSGLRRVEYWLRPDAGRHGQIEDDDPAWKKAEWKPCAIDPQPDDWANHLPEDVKPHEIWGFDPRTGRPKEWPLRYSTVAWSVTLKDLQPGAYEFRVRTVDLNGYTQPEPRPDPKTGRNEIQCKTILVMR